MARIFAALFLAAATGAALAGSAGSTVSGPLLMPPKPDPAAMLTPVQTDGQKSKATGRIGAEENCGPGSDCWNLRQQRNFDDEYWAQRRFREHRRQARRYQSVPRQYPGYSDNYIPEFHRDGLYNAPRYR